MLTLNAAKGKYLPLTSPGVYMKNSTTGRRKIVRMQGYDYTQPGAYFVTICTEHRAHLFGNVINGEMAPNDIGAMVRRTWDALPDAFAGVVADSMIVMPDHVHGVIMLGTDPNIEVLPRLGDVVRYFKGRSTSHYSAKVRISDWPPLDGRLWQRRFIDRIVRNDDELARIYDYIEANPYRWEQRKRGEM